MNIKEMCAKGLLQLKDKSPELCIIGGVACIIGGIVLACKATLDIDKVKDEIKEEVDVTVKDAAETMERIDNAVEYGNKQMPDGSTYNEGNAQKDKVAVYAKSTGKIAKTFFRVAKAYAPATGLVVTGFALIFLSHKIMRDRNASLLAAYTAIDTAFKAYRARVIEDGGKELDSKYLYGTKTVSEEVKRINPDTGLEETVVETHEEIAYPLGSPYARIFDANTSIYYEEHDPNNDFNRTTVLQAQAWANDLLNSRGYVFLNEVYRKLGIEESPVGQIVGWWKNNENGDGYIDFNVDACFTDPRFKDFIEIGKFRRKIVLDFNVDGVINKFFKSNADNGLDEDQLAELSLMKKAAESADPNDRLMVQAEIHRQAVLNR